MNPAPHIIGDLRTVCYTPIDERHRFTGRTRQIVNGELMGAMAGLAICEQDEPRFYLFGCDANWNVVTDTWHESLEDAKMQAEHEYHGVAGTWMEVGK